jgi:hypothetical protein
LVGYGLGSPAFAVEDVAMKESRFGGELARHERDE